MAAAFNEVKIHKLNNMSEIYVVNIAEILWQILFSISETNSVITYQEAGILWYNPVQQSGCDAALEAEDDNNEGRKEEKWNTASSTKMGGQ